MAMPTGEHCWKKNSGAPWALTLIQTTNWQYKNASKNFNHTIADRFRTVSCSNDSHPTGVVRPVYGISTFSLTTKGRKQMCCSLSSLMRKKLVLVIIKNCNIKSQCTLNVLVWFYIQVKLPLKKLEKAVSYMTSTGYNQFLCHEYETCALYFGHLLNDFSRFVAYIIHIIYPY